MKSENELKDVKQVDDDGNNKSLPWFFCFCQMSCFFVYS